MLCSCMPCRSFADSCASSSKETVNRQACWLQGHPCHGPWAAQLTRCCTAGHMWPECTWCCQSELKRLPEDLHVSSHALQGRQARQRPELQAASAQPPSCGLNAGSGCCRAPSAGCTDSPSPAPQSTTCSLSRRVTAPIQASSMLAYTAAMTGRERIRWPPPASSSTCVQAGDQRQLCSLAGPEPAWHNPGAAQSPARRPAAGLQSMQDCICTRTKCAAWAQKGSAGQPAPAHKRRNQIVAPVQPAWLSVSDACSCTPAAGRSPPTCPSPGAQETRQGSDTSVQPAWLISRALTAGQRPQTCPSARRRPRWTPCCASCASTARPRRTRGTARPWHPSCQPGNVRWKHAAAHLLQDGAPRLARLRADDVDGRLALGA